MLRSQLLNRKVGCKVQAKSLNAGEAFYLRNLHRETVSPGIMTAGLNDTGLLKPAVRLNWARNVNFSFDF